MTTLTRRNPLAAQTDITLATETTSAPGPSLHYDYNLVATEHRSAIMLSARRIKDKAERSKRDLLDIGKELTETKAKLEHGQFGDWLSIEFGMSERSAQRFMSVYETYGSKSDTVSLLNDSALYLLSGPSVPAAARQEVEQQAQTSGKSPTKAEVQQVIARHKPPSTRSASSNASANDDADSAQPKQRTLTIDETLAVILRKVEHEIGKSQPGPQLDWLKAHSDASLFCQTVNTDPFYRVSIDLRCFREAYQQAIALLTAEAARTAQEAPQPSPPPLTPPPAPTSPPAPTAPTGNGQAAPDRTERITGLRKLCMGLIDSLPDYGELTGDYSSTLALRRALEPMIRKLEENLV